MAQLKQQQTAKNSSSSNPEMKSTSFLLIFCSLVVGLAAARESPDPVRDVNGKILHTGTNYYVLPVVRGNGGGLTLSSVGNYSCPLQVVQEPQELTDGLPLKFWPVNLKKGVIRLSTDLNIAFSAVPGCGQKPVWKIDDYDYSNGQWFVTTGGSVGRPGSETLSNWFKIERYGNDYKIVYCPSVCPYCEDVMCRDVGIFWEDGVRRLALSYGDPIGVMFKKAN